MRSLSLCRLLILYDKVQISAIQIWSVSSRSHLAPGLLLLLEPLGNAAECVPTDLRFARTAVMSAILRVEIPER
jgi:hypothetical protein